MRQKLSPLFRASFLRVTRNLCPTLSNQVIAGLIALLAFAAIAPAQTANDRFVRPEYCKRQSEPRAREGSTNRWFPEPEVLNEIRQWLSFLRFPAS